MSCSKPEISSKQPKIIKKISVNQLFSLFYGELSIKQENDFESESEILFSEIEILKTKKLVFLRKSTRLNKKIKKRKNFTNFTSLNLLNFLTKRNEKDSDQKTKYYVCDFCLKPFKSSSSKGGHISRNHAGESKEYKKRKKSQHDRNIERKRNKFYKALLKDQD